ncbi:MAG: hypothetical protein K6F50_01175 [Kiritimatiellae bacterium]|nr:hypothetical protein [Kiritimatiellia bacterium]
MKKLMIAAAVAALTAGVYAGNCSDEPEVDCADVFTVKFSGKTTQEKNATYKTVVKLSGKGTLQIDADYVTETLAVKVGKDKYDVILEDGEVTKFTYFGKKLETVLDDNTKKPGKNYKLESDLGVKFEDQTEYAINVNQVAFGNMNVYVTKAKTIKGGACGEDTDIEGCELVLTPKSYKGWFTGDFQTCLDEEAFLDDCVEFDADGATSLIGGTWSAKYSKKLSK